MMFSPQQALAAIMALAPTDLCTQSVPLDAASGRILAQDIVAPANQPPAAVSAMDGYALCLAGDEVGPITRTLVGESAAGHPYAGALDFATCVRISTGAVVPMGANTVVMQENTTADGPTITCHQVKVGQHMRPAGGDFHAGDILVARGTRLSAGHIGLCAAAGVAQVVVAALPRIHILSCGDELVRVGAQASGTQIYDSAAPMLASLLQVWGAQTQCFGPAPDDSRRLKDMIAQASVGCDIMVMIGAASVGPHDHGRASLGAAQFVVEKIAIKPGKPTYVATKDGQIIFGLPGNPASALVCARLFLVPLLLAHLGARHDGPAKLPLAMGVTAAGARAEADRVRWGQDGQNYGLLRLGNQDSSLVHVLAESSGVILRPANDGPLAAGALVDYFDWQPLGIFGG